MSKKNHRRTLQQHRKENKMQTLHGRLLRYCKLKGITPEESDCVVRCVMPSGFERLSVYKKPITRIVNLDSYQEYGIMEYFYINRKSYLDERAAKYLFEKLGIEIEKMEKKESEI